MNTKLVIIGGFLGAGKTTLLGAAARRLSEQGHSVGLITNDQAPDLVDTSVLTGSGMGVMEVSGSCFCCNFQGFAHAVQSLIERRAGLILAEPVGSCTDLAATVLRPLKHRRPDIDLAPLTVLASPDQVREALRQAGSAMHDSALYILGLQMAESDHLLLSKVDSLAADERAALVRLLREKFPAKAIGEISPRTGSGIDAWLASVLAGGEAGANVVDVDHDRYAEGEAVFGWLNASIQLEAPHGQTDLFRPALELLESLQREFRSSGSEIGHVKAVVETGGRRRVANLTSLRGSVSALDDSPLTGTVARLVLNARVQMPAPELGLVAQRAIGSLNGPAVTACTTTFRVLTPGRPQPTFRYPRLWDV